MEESLGAQYALQVALQTLKERCQQFQQRLFVLEEENLNLRKKCNQNSENTHSLSEIDSLKTQVAQLSEQKTHLLNNIFMVTTENRQLWSRLSKLTQANETLGSQLNKINDTLTQHKISPSTSAKFSHTPLIRSKTFTQEDPQIKFHQKTIIDENEKISSELEDISLKLISNIAKEKSELELQCSQMAEIQNNDTILINSFGFAYPIIDVEDAVVDNFQRHVKELCNIKDILFQENNKMQKNLANLKIIHGKAQCKTSEEPERESKATMTSLMHDKEEENDLESLSKWGTPENSNTFPNKTVGISKISQCLKAHESEPDKICPMCSKIFYDNTKFTEFQSHVESHFIVDQNTGNFSILS